MRTKVNDNERKPLVPTTPPKTTIKFCGYCNYSMRNIILSGFGFFLVYCGYYPVQSLVTKIHGQKGFYALGTLYYVYAVSLLFSAAIVRKMGPRASQIFGYLCYLPFMLSNISVELWYYLISAGLLGFGASLVWTGNGTYLIQLSTKENIGTHTGIFYTMYLAGNLVGNAVTSFLLNTVDTSNGLLFFVLTCFALAGCLELLLLGRSDRRLKSQTSEDINGNGANEKSESESNQGSDLIEASPSSNNSIHSPKQQEQFLGGDPKKVNELKSVLLEIKKTFVVLQNVQALLCSPLNMIMGISVGIVFGFLPPMMEKKKIPIVMLVFGLTDSIGCFLNGKLIDKFGIFATALLSIFFEICSSIICFFVSSKNENLFFVIFALFGFGDSGINTLIYPLSYQLFENNVQESLSVFKFIRSLSCASAFLYSNHLSLPANLAILLSLLVLAIICISLLNFKSQKIGKNDKKTNK
ncbi:et translation product-related [Anaeramoeba flamelloides]|uniref:UNC93-like protein MFSD11 n=1 Tax=Anaeramoeba flamelloides TaxID=1746091 RepID=A0ABQ8XYY2_9EUKA|nr:et translation product-related [Anaeramoeba flamelloides]